MGITDEPRTSQLLRGNTTYSNRLELGFMLMNLSDDGPEGDELCEVEELLRAQGAEIALQG